MDNEDWESYPERGVDSDADIKNEDDEELPYTSGSIPKLQFRKDISKACWNTEMGMAEVIENKGGMWATTGIVRRGKLYCSIEETLFLAERGALILLDVNDAIVSLKDIYAKIGDKKSRCSWESFEAYRHLKSLGYIVGRHGIPWTMKSEKNCSISSYEATQESNGTSNKELEVDVSVVSLVRAIQIDDVEPNFDIYMPNSKFRKSCPGNPCFKLYITRGPPPTKTDIEVLERKCKGIPLKIGNVEHGRVSFFCFNRTELPLLP